MVAVMQRRGCHLPINLKEEEENEAQEEEEKE